MWSRPLRYERLTWREVRRAATEDRVDRIWEGTSEIQRGIIADQLAKRGTERLIG